MSSSVAIHFSILSLALELINAYGLTATSHDKMDDWRFIAGDALLPLCFGLFSPLFRAREQEGSTFKVLASRAVLCRLSQLKAAHTGTDNSHEL